MASDGNISTGYIKIYRALADKWWYTKSNHVHLFIHLMLKASHSERQFDFGGKRYELQPGQFVTGRKILSKETGLPETTIERILNVFQKDGVIGQQTTNKNRVITIVSWDYYQKDGQQTDNKRTANGQRVDTYNNDNNLKRKKRKSIDAAIAATDQGNFDNDHSLVKDNVHQLAVTPPAENISNKKNVFPTLQQLQDYFFLKMWNPNLSGSWMQDRCINEAYKMHNHYTANGWVQGKNKPIKSWQAAANNWIVNSKKGTFEKSIDNGGATDTNFNTPAIVATTSSKSRIEINRLYATYLEDAGKVTILSIQPTYWKEIKAGGLQLFSNEELIAIKQQAEKYLTDKGSALNDDLVKITAGKLAVLESFKRYKALDYQVIFTQNQPENTVFPLAG